jgi:hypothetical protein
MLKSAHGPILAPLADEKLNLKHAQIDCRSTCEMSIGVLRPHTRVKEPIP